MADSFVAYINQQLTGVPYRGYLRPRKNYQASIFFVSPFSFPPTGGNRSPEIRKKQKRISPYIYKSYIG
jgi:hypothetical protein